MDTHFHRICGFSPHCFLDKSKVTVAAGSGNLVYGESKSRSAAAPVFLHQVVRMWLGRSSGHRGATRKPRSRHLPYLGLRESHTTMMNKATGTHSTAFLVRKPRDYLCSKSPFTHSVEGSILGKSTLV